MMRLTSMALVVSDAKKSVAWYKEKLGWEERAKEGHWVTVAPKDSKLEFHLCEKFHPLEPGNTGVAFMAKDVAKAEKDLRAKGVKFTTPTTKEDWGVYAMFADPDGNEFWLMQE